MMLLLESAATIRTHQDDVSVTGSPLGFSATLADITASSVKINSEAGYSLALGVQDFWPNVTSTPTLLQPHRPQGLSFLFSSPCTGLLSANRY